jgi:hypothetical protein
MRATIEQELSPTQAVERYHEHLGEHGMTPHRALEDDLQITEPVLES